MPFGVEITTPHETFVWSGTNPSEVGIITPHPSLSGVGIFPRVTFYGWDKFVSDVVCL